ncbi:MAG TPA: sigma-54 dependent transcriptional regulator [Kofleriaceae bacterium]|nr:sigma-54 dependent transcriptional regulator [Kofleriaceae bacterium]
MEQRPNPGSCDVCGMMPLASTLNRSARVVSESPAMQTLLKRAARFARSDAPVVVLGDTGTGKEVVARILHANSGRASHPFVAVNVAALPSELLESELFGHGKGAFTGAVSARRGLFEEAGGGTLFLDEIGEMPLPLQAKLLRVLQDGEVRRVGENRAFAVDVRIICATHRDPRARIREGLFREDLYFRLKVLTLTMPALRDRREDILPLATEFLREEPRPLVGFTDEAKARLLAYSWPGNVRELQNAVKHGAALATGPQVNADDLPDEVRLPLSPSSPLPAALDPLCSLAEIEKAHILRVIGACGGSQIEAARVLGIARTTLWRKLRAYTEA